MRRIYKYPIETTDEQNVKMPRGARILCVQTQVGQPCLWAMIDDEEPESVYRKIIIHGTGHPISPEVEVGRYIGTYQLLSGSLIFHAFEGV